MDALCALPLLCSQEPVSPRGGLLLIWYPNFYTWSSSFCGCTPQLAGSGGQRAYIPGSQGTVTIGKIVLQQLPSPGPCTESRLKHTPIVWNRPVWLCRSFSLRGRHLVWHTFGGYWNTPQGWRMVVSVFSLSLGSPSLPYSLTPGHQYFLGRSL